MAEGRSNAGIAASLVVSEGTVEKHVANIFGKLGFPVAEADNRRVLAVLQLASAAMDGEDQGAVRTKHTPDLGQRNRHLVARNVNQGVEASDSNA
jgi:hypothetical protein